MCVLKKVLLTITVKFPSIFHFYSRQLLDLVEQVLSYLWIFLWLLGTNSSLRNPLYIKNFTKNLRTHAQGVPLVSGMRDIWGRKSSWYMWKSVDVAFWGFWNTYVSKRRKISRRRRNIVDSVFESWWFIFLKFKKNIGHKNSSRRTKRGQKCS